MTDVQTGGLSVGSRTFAVRQAISATLLRRLSRLDRSCHQFALCTKWKCQMGFIRIALKKTWRIWMQDVWCMENSIVKALCKSCGIPVNWSHTKFQDVWLSVTLFVSRALQKKNTPLLTWNLGIPSKCPCRWKALDRWPKGLVLNLKMNYARGWLARRCCNKSWTVRGEFCYIGVGVVLRRCSRSSFLPGEGFDFWTMTFTCPSWFLQIWDDLLSEALGTRARLEFNSVSHRSKSLQSTSAC